MVRTGEAGTALGYATPFSGAGDDGLTDGSNSGGGKKAGLAREFSRRQVLLGAAGGLVLAGAGGVIGYEWPRSKRATAAGTKAGTHPNPDEISRGLVERGQVLRFVTRPDLRPPKVTVTSYAPSPSSPPYIFLAPRSYLSGEEGQHGLMAIDRSGRLVWYQPVGPQPFDLKVQSYRGKPVLTWWQGDVVYDYGVGTGEMASTSYEQLQQIRAGNGLKADLHELRLTSAGTALLTAYQVVPADLSAVGGKAKGKLVVGHAQEVDLATGKVLFDWDSLAHVPMEDSYKKINPPGDEYDYFHINSIAEMPDGDLLISSLGTWALYKVDRSTGNIVWCLGGKRSDFSFGPGARFYWQHDALPHGPDLISVFDDGAWPPEERQSRGLLLNVDTKSMHVSLRQAYLQPARFLAANQGNVQMLPDGRAFVGWGNQPYFSEFSPGGELLLDGQMPFGYRSYRALTHDWQGTPAEPPVAVAVGNPANGVQVFASWNGATAVEQWLVLGGKEPTSLQPVGAQPWAGFETGISLNATGPWFAVVAMGAGGKEMGRSCPVKSLSLAPR